MLFAPSVLLSAVLLYDRQNSSDNRSPVDGTGSPSLSWPAAGDLEGEDWATFQRGPEGATVDQDSIAGRYRLAGTFFTLSESPSRGGSRKAVLHDVKTGTQHIMSEGASLDETLVLRVYLDRVILKTASGEEELRLNFTDQGGENPDGTATAAGTGSKVPGLVGDRFGGRRVGESRWLFKRESLLGYYAELRDDPGRLVKVFDSLKPLYDGDRKITGYQLGVEGEKEFFDAVGLVEGDVIREVNALPMTNRRRAEHFISQFVGNHANAFVLEIDRGGKSEKLIYQVR